MNTQELLACLKTEAAEIDRLMEDDLAAVACPHLPEVLRHAIFNGGKRIRPLLAVFASRVAGQPPDQEAMGRLAMTFEYLHAASLLHDDVIDHADQRRGQPTANVVWSNKLSILAGDFLHARAMTLAGLVGGVECLGVIGQATADMVEAEFLQLETAARSGLAADDYFSVIAGKTAALIAAACETGVMFAAGGPDDRAAMRLYGRNLGLAFQIVDDLLDYEGDPEMTGKAVGNDFVEGKMTLPLLLALEEATSEARREILDLLAEPAETRQKAIRQARDFIRANDGFGLARRRAEKLISEAIQALARFADSQAKMVLNSLAGYVLYRDK